MSGNADNSSGDAGTTIGVVASVRLEAYARHLQAGGRTVNTDRFDRGVARNFEQWIHRTGRDIRSVSDRDIRAYRETRRADRQGWLPRSRNSLTQEVATARRYVRFLEKAGSVDHPGEQQLAESLLQDFIDARCKLGYRHDPLDQIRSHCGHFVRWLHLSRVSIRSIGRQAVEVYCQHDCVCDGGTRSGRSDTGRRYARTYIGEFIDFLAERGVIELEPEPTTDDGELELLQRFLAWLRTERGLCEATVRHHSRHVRFVFAELGWGPSEYDPTRIRRALEKAFSRVSHTHARHLATSTRFFLRYLAARRLCPAQWVAVVPKARRVALAELPRYLPEEGVQGVIDSCDQTTATGLRDRAILLLLSHLGFRAGDVAALRLGDLEWSKARIVVCGKNRQETLLPLPQAVGDAILAYLEVRPRVPHDAVFLRSPAPQRPFRDSRAVSDIVARAIRRSGVASPGGRGGHLLRHSFATHALRAGASLETVGAVLRHDSPRTTAIYAKVDLPTLQAIAQPWIDAGAEA